MEVCEKSSLWLLNKIFYSCLQTEPFELARDQLVASHNGINSLSPISTHQRTTSSFLRLVPEKKKFVYYFNYIIYLNLYETHKLQALRVFSKLIYASV